MTERLHFHFSLPCTGEGNGNPLQCSCLENPRDRGAWWAAVYGVAQSRTRLKRLSCSMYSWASLVAQLVRICLQCRRPRFNPWVGKMPWRRDRLSSPVFLGFPGGSDGKESAHNARYLGSSPGLGRVPGRGHGSPPSVLAWRNSMDRGAWWATIHGVPKSQTLLSD